MKTERIYLTEMHLLESEARVIGTGEDDGRTYFVPDRSPLHPQGGGQPADRGSLRRASGEKITIETVRNGPDGAVRHYAEVGEELAGEVVTLEVDAELRSLLSRIHSAGHVIDMAVSELGWGWKPGKGFHFPEGAYVEYEGDLEAAGEDRVDVLVRKCEEIIARDTRVSVSHISRAELEKDPRVEIDTIPAGDEVRVVSYGEFRIPCGGTHVASLAEVGDVTIRKIKSKKGMIRVGYDVGS